MRYLILLVLLTMSCTDKKQDKEKIIELQNIISAVENQDFSIFDKYFSKEKLFPIFILQDTIFIDPDYDDIKTTLIIYSNKGCSIAYTNKYGMLFLENSKELVSYEEILNIANQISEIRGNELSWIYRQLSRPLANQDSRMKNSIIYHNLLYLNSQILINNITQSKSLEQFTNSLLPILSVDNNSSYQQYLFTQSIGNTQSQLSSALKNHLVLSLYYPWYDILFYGYGYKKNYFTIAHPVKMQAPIIYP